jgi:hypothetical protein
MSRWLLRVSLAVVLGVVADSGRATAQQPGRTGPIQPVVHEMGQSQVPVVVRPVAPVSVEAAAPCAGQPTEAGQPEHGWLHNTCMKCLNSVGLGCAASHDTVGCTSCYAQYIFFFGSCRQFFGEPCIPWGPDNLPGKHGGSQGGGAGCSKCGW